MSAIPRFNKGRTLLVAFAISLLSILAIGLGLHTLQPQDAPLAEVKSLMMNAQVSLLILGIKAAYKGRSSGK